MILPFKRGWGCRLGIRPPCLCMAHPQRIVLGFFEQADIDLTDWQRGHVLALYDGEAKLTRPRRCQGDCPVRDADDLSFVT